MIFLMNDAVLNVDMRALMPARTAGRFRALTLDAVIRLGCDLYSEAPLLHRTAPQQAARLAALIVHKAPHVNAALFAAPRAGCGPEQVASRLERVSADVLAGLDARQAEHALTPYVADSEVWRRMAA